MTYFYESEIWDECFHFANDFGLSSSFERLERDVEDCLCFRLFLQVGEEEGHHLWANDR